MALTDPELALLLDALDEDPGDDVYLQVGEDLLRRARWADAERVLKAGLEAAPEEPGWAMLARARLELGDPEAALAAVVQGPRDLPDHAEAARIELLALERCGDLTQAREKAETFLTFDANDVVITALWDRLEAPPPTAPVHSPDPTVSVAAAERYVVIGRYDRALRLYRRLAWHNPDHRELQVRLRALSSEHPEAEEATRDSTTDAVPIIQLAPLAVVPRFGMGTPVPVERTALPAALPLDDDAFDVPDAPNIKRRRRRSLVNPDQA